MGGFASFRRLGDARFQHARYGDMYKRVINECIILIYNMVVTSLIIEHEPPTHIEYFEIIDEELLLTEAILHTNVTSDTINVTLLERCFLLNACETLQQMYGRNSINT